MCWIRFPENETNCKFVVYVNRPPSMEVSLLFHRSRYKRPGNGRISLELIDVKDELKTPNESKFLKKSAIPLGTNVMVCPYILRYFTSLLLRPD